MSENLLELCLEIIWKAKFVHYDFNICQFLSKWLNALLLWLGMHVFCFVFEFAVECAMKEIN